MTRNQRARRKTVMITSTLLISPAGRHEPSPNALANMLPPSAVDWDETPQNVRGPASSRGGKRSCRNCRRLCSRPRRRCGASVAVIQKNVVRLFARGMAGKIVARMTAASP